MSDDGRNAWLALDDEALIKQCRVDTCRGTGPGGQKRNKTSSAVRLTHLPSGIAAMNDESRSQHVNRLFAVRRLRMEIAIKVRETPEGGMLGEAPGANSNGYALWAAKALDILQSVEYRVSDGAALIGVSTGRLVKELLKSPAVWQAVNSERVARGLGALKA